jgi:hypothetical protein
MTQFNLSNSSTSGAESSAFQSAQSALARKPLPGPRWAWPGAAALAVAAVAYLVAGTSGEHASHRAAPSPSAEGAPPEAPGPTTTTVAALEPAAPVAAPPDPPASAPVNDLAASPAKVEAEAAKASDDSKQAVASASVTTKKKARGNAHRAKRKRSARAD